MTPFSRLLGAAALATLVVFSEAQESRSRPTVSIDGDRFLVDGKPTYPGRYWRGNKVEGLLLNARLVQGVFDDENPETRRFFHYPDTGVWDPDRNTNEFVKAMSVWHEYGLNAFTINMQGGSPTGYGNKTWKNTGFTAAGDLKQTYLDRLKRILDRAEELKMIVILGYFYFGQDQNVADEAAVIRAVDKLTLWLLENGYGNVLVEINNECDVRSYDHDILKPNRVHELIRRVKQTTRDGRRLLVSTSFKGRAIPTENVVREADFILLHGNGVKEPPFIKEMVKRTKEVPGYRGQPIVFNEDDHYDYDQDANNFKFAIESYASWGYFDFRRGNEKDIRIGYQSVPVDWGVNHERKRDFFEYVKEISGY